MSILYDDIFYSAGENRQLFHCEKSQKNFLVIKKNSVLVFADRCLTQGIDPLRRIDNIPGDSIVAMKTFENDKILILTNDGFLSCFSIFTAGLAGND